MTAAALQGVCLSRDALRASLRTTAEVFAVNESGEIKNREEAPTHLSSRSLKQQQEKDVQTRTGKAAGVFQRLWNIWSSKSIIMATKPHLYMSVVIPPATYACETWMKTTSITNTLDVFHHLCLRSILKISWRDQITDGEVMRRTGVAPSSDIVSDRRKRMTGHGLRPPRERPASVAIEGGRRRHEDEQPRKT
ncbi:hypothetical protein DPX16_7487 [Xyrichtys novacula]|uniref:Uncharacterized protein n=1 Tax=Xyrichtys novacula TaxID=13765 RepID=A0AAV1G3L5_XYRNO|nr:hypothetical protein DPX16_7487 [Xyrichtys novacula]